MPQFGFYMAGAGIAAAGRTGLLIAWNPMDHPSSIADELDWSEIALYSWIGSLPTISPAVFKMRSRSPVSINAQDCPMTLDGGIDRDFFIRFGIKPGGSSASLIADGWLEVFEGSTRLYGVAPPAGTIKVELASGSIAAGLTEYSMQDRVVTAGLEDELEEGGWLLGSGFSAIEIWRELMTPDRELSWSPI